MNAIKEDYVSFEVAKLLKEKGFDEQCRAFYKCWPVNPVLYKCDNTQVFDYCTNSSLTAYNIDEEMNIAAPTLQMACKWLREYKKLVISIDLNYSDNSYSYLIDSIIEHRIVGNGLGETYEEAVEVALKYVLENLI